MFTAYIIKKRYMLIIDGHDVYEIDEECIKKHRVKGECKVLEKLKEKEQRRQKNEYRKIVKKAAGRKRPAVKNVNQQPQPHPQPLLLLPQPKPPQQKSKMIAQIQLLLPFPQSFPPKKEPPLPFPQQQHSKRIIHKIEEHPPPLSVLLHEQFVAAKSLISDLQ